jgi:hypothetical protein
VLRGWAGRYRCGWVSLTVVVREGQLESVLAPSRADFQVRVVAGQQRGDVQAVRVEVGAVRVALLVDLQVVAVRDVLQ